jgi:hypothetical protein
LLCLIGKYGVFDPVEQNWVGNTEGALRYDDRDLARIAAAIVCKQMDWPLDRLQVKVCDLTNPQFVREDATVRTSLEALQQLEGFVENEDGSKSPLPEALKPDPQLQPPDGVRPRRRRRQA